MALPPDSGRAGSPRLPAFARADAEAPWRPSAQLLAESRPAALISANSAAVTSIAELGARHHP